MAITANPFANGYLHGKLVPAYNEHFFLCLGPSTSGFSVQLEHSCSAVLKRAHTPLDLGRCSILFAAVVCRFSIVSRLYTRIGACCLTSVYGVWRRSLEIRVDRLFLA
ncbi:hypothetical protein KP509_02G019000 [Ceratopteris richardii]|uniref:Uncharacterized protein n=1 Tax=Ceratopteris richardii TaxID=49495 RepID=A0A8T2V6S6_CERRI|nr:hypothetical protein KP509_02G019000 [Ceratopteris richardii]